MIDSKYLYVHKNDSDMVPDVQIITSLISAIVGGIVATILKTLLEKRKDIEITHKKIIEGNYRSLLIFMACALDYDKRRYFSLNEQVPNETSEDYMRQLKEYYYHSVLYSSDKVLSAIKTFIATPSQEAYIKVAKEMRQELWGRKTSLSFADIIIEPSAPITE